MTEEEHDEQSVLHIHFRWLNFKGCIGFVLGLTILWALLFGVTIGGRRYGIAECRCDEGVIIHAGEEQ